MHSRTAAALLLLITSATPSLAVEPSAAEENDQLLKVIDEFCINPRGTVAEMASRAMKLPYQPRPMAVEKGPPYARGVALMKLRGGTLLSFSGAKADSPIDDCEVVAHSRDAVALIARLRQDFSLPEGKGSSFDVQQRTSGQTTINGRLVNVKLVYGFEENKTSGAFTLTVNR